MEYNIVHTAVSGLGLTLRVAPPADGQMWGWEVPKVSQKQRP